MGLRGEKVVIASLPRLVAVSAAMEILFVSPEVAPFTRGSSVADVAAALPKALRALGHRTHVITLRHGGVAVDNTTVARRLQQLIVPLGADKITVDVYEARLSSGLHVTMLDAPALTQRDKVYGEPDDHLRYALLCRGAIEWVKMMGVIPDVIHAHDWGAALTPLYLAMAAEKDPTLANVRTVFTVHDAENRGLFDKKTLASIGIPDRYFAPSELEFYGQVCWLKYGILKSNRVTAPSPTYAKELATAEVGRGLEGVVKHRGRDFTGILHGVDFSVFNPATDPHLAARFDAEGLDGRERCRTDLAEVTGLSQKNESPIFGYVGPIDAARGLDLLAACATRIMRNESRWVIAGTGDAGLVTAFTALTKRFPDRFAFRETYTDAFAHKVYAGSDFWVAPSRREPGAVSHLYAMRYGAIPVARATGAVCDAVVDCDARFESGTGFLFDGADPDELFGAIGRAIGVFRRRDVLNKLRHRIMRKDVSWDRCARQYDGIYQSLVK